MFTDVVVDLKKGILPQDLLLLQKRVDIAMIKKMAVLRLPYHFWTNDPKVNPLSEQLVWTALILEKSEIFGQVEEALAMELSEKLRGKSGASELAAVVHERLEELMDQFVAFAPNESFRHVLAEKIRRSPWSGQSEN